MDKKMLKEPAMKAIHLTGLAALTALIGFAASVAWAGDERTELRVAESVRCACLVQGNVA
ncbi:MAG: hypothetical protein KIT35_00925 [Piscinibacter sp.]|uniref:hypothetical protein n=1 Tax=Piscinibacter TaxID=1114981 RepID=UPI000FDE6CD5|nr:MULTISPECIES: hypothetical protein [Piscinibacter]MCW5662371.1 hypothetical protein [Piscinibacter sp.]